MELATFIVFEDKEAGKQMVVNYAEMAQNGQHSLLLVKISPGSQGQIPSCASS